jgi:hypothetical protein
MRASGLTGESSERRLAQQVVDRLLDLVLVPCPELLGVTFADRADPPFELEGVQGSVAETAAVRGVETFSGHGTSGTTSRFIVTEL